MGSSVWRARILVTPGVAQHQGLPCIRLAEPDPEIAVKIRERWLTADGHYGLGLLMGSPFPDGTTLGALDIDHNDYMRIGQALLRDPPCGRIGKKGAAFFVRVRGAARNLTIPAASRSARADPRGLRYCQ
jgi:hypothetical protein